MEKHIEKEDEMVWIIGRDFLKDTIFPEQVKLIDAEKARISHYKTKEDCREAIKHSWFPGDGGYG